MNSKIKFYIASSLDNTKAVNQISDYFTSRGWSQTYNWAKHGAVPDSDQISRISSKELKGVKDCDIFYLLLPGKRGSHTELGAALAFKKQTIILAPDQSLFNENGITCSFYWHPNITNRVIEPDIFALACSAYRIGINLKRRK